MPGAKDSRPAPSARKPARPVAAALRPGAAQVQPCPARAPFNAQDPAEGAGRGGLEGAGPRRPRPRPRPSPTPTPKGRHRPLRAQEVQGGLREVPSRESPSRPNPDQTFSLYAACQAVGSRPLSLASPPAAPQKGGETGPAALM